MNQAMKRSPALFMALIMCIALLPVLHFDASAANAACTENGHQVRPDAFRTEILLITDK